MPNIRQEVLIGSPAEKVYSAITSQDGLSAWWTPDTKISSEMDSVGRFGFGKNYFKEMKVVDLTRFSRVKWFCTSGADEWVGTTISFNLQSGDKETLLNSHPEAADQIQQNANGDNETLLSLHHDGWREYTPMFAECSYTWGQFLRSLKLLCETGKGRPWPHQHRTER
jgi:uncharacterized protein YndB with AHSA1/START domain